MDNVEDMVCSKFLAANSRERQTPYESRHDEDQEPYSCAFAGRLRKEALAAKQFAIMSNDDPILDISSKECILLII